MTYKLIIKTMNDILLGNYAMKQCYPGNFILCLQLVLFIEIPVWVQKLLQY